MKTLDVADTRNDLKVQVGDAIRRMRTLRRMTQAGLAKDIGVRDATISNIERGANLPDIPTLIVIANRLRVTTDHLLGRRDDPVEGETLADWLRAEDGEPMPPAVVSAEAELPLTSRVRALEDQMKALLAGSSVAVRRQAEAIEESQATKTTPQSPAKKARPASGGRKDR